MRSTLKVAAVAAVLCSFGLSAEVVTVRAEQVGVDDLKLTSGADPRDVQVAFDSERNLHLVVWDEGVAPDTELIRGRIFDSTGTAVGAALTIGQSPVIGGVVGEPAVTFDPLHDRWWIAYTADDTIVGEREIHVNTVTAAGVVGTAFAVSSMGDDTAAYDARRPDIVVNSTADEVFVVWQGDDTVPGDGEDEIWGQRIDDSLAEVGTDDVQLSALGTDGDPLVDAAAPQVAWNPVANGYAVVHEQQDSLAPTAVWAQLVPANGVPTAAASQVAAGTAGTLETGRPTVAADDLGAGYLVAWDEFTVASNAAAIKGRTMSAVGVLGASTLTFSASGVDSQSPDLAYQPSNDRYGLVFHADVLAGTAVEYEIHGMLLDPTGAVAVPLERLSTMGVDGTASSVTVDPVVAPAVRGRLFTVWASDNPDPAAGTGQTVSGDLEVFGQTFQPDGPPTVTIEQGASQADPVNAGPVVFDVVFSESVTGFLAADVTVTRSGVTGGTVTVTGSGANYTVSIAGMTGSGTIRASLGAGVAADATSNPSEASTSTDNTVTFDAVKPTVVVAQASSQVDPAKVGPVVFDVTFSESVTGFVAADVTVGGTASGTLVASVSGSGSAYSVSVSGMTGDGTVTVSVPAGGAADAAGNTNAASTSTDNSVTLDTTGPTVVVAQASSQADPANAGPVVFDVTFSESVTGFVAADVTVGGTASGTLVASVSGTGSAYSVSVSGMTGDGTVTVSVPAGGAADAAGNTNAASTSTDNSVTLDTVRPTVTVEQGASQADPTNAGPVVFDVVFSEPVTGFAAADVTVSRSGVTGGTASVSGSGSTYSVSVSGATGSGTLSVSVPAGGATDAAGNTNTASTSTDASVAFDDEAPSVSVEQGASQADPVNAGPVVFDVVFSESVSGFGAADVDLSASTASGALVASVSGSGGTYEVSVSGMSGDGTISMSVPADAATDAAGNGNTASTSTDGSVIFDVTVPSVTVEQGASQDDPTRLDPVVFDVVFSEPVTGFEPADVEVGGTATGTLIWAVTGSGDTYEVSVFGMTGDGTVTASVPDDAATDAAGNGNSASTSTDGSVAFDVTSPLVSVEQGASQADPVNAGPVVFDVVFSESVSGFGAADVDLSASTASGALVASVSGSGDTYEVSVSGMTGDGTVSMSVPADAATDAAGNGNTASTSTDGSVAFDVSSPLVSVEQGASQADPVNAGPVVFEVVFSESVSGFSAADVTVARSGVTGGTVSVSGSGDTYEVSLSGMTGDGTVSVSVPADAAADAAGNVNTASTSTDATVALDVTAPSVGVDQAVGQDDPTNTGPVRFEVVFSEPVTGFVPADVAIGGTAPGPVTAVVAGSGDTYTVSVDGMTGAGTVTVAVAAGAAVDTAGNGSLASTSTDALVLYVPDDPNPGTNDAPVVSAPSSMTVERAVAVALTGANAVSVTDADALGDPIEVTLEVTDGSVDVGTTPGVTVVGDRTEAATITGPQAAVAAALAGTTVAFDVAGANSLDVTADDLGHSPGPALTSSATVDVTVTDTTPPTIGVPSVTVSVTTEPGKPGATVTYTVTITDPGAPDGTAGAAPKSALARIAADPTVSCTPPSGSFFPIGATMVTCTASDATGNSSTASFLVEVLDEEAPAIDGSDQSVAVPGGGDSGPLAYTVPTATDNSGGPVDVVCDPEVGTVVPAGRVVVTCTATDPSGNTASTTFVVTVMSGVLPPTGAGGLVPAAALLLLIGAVLATADRRRPA